MSDEKTSEDEKKDAAAAPPEPEETVAEAKGAEAEEEAEEEEASPLDSASPEAIARRVAALGDDDKDEARTREEERKLAERRAGTRKKGIKKGGLEVSASKKLAKIGTRAEPKRAVAVASDADPLIERTTKLTEWAKQNQRTVQVVGGLVAVALLGVAGFMYREHKQETEASALLTKAVDDERARVGEPPKEDPENPVDAPLSFKTFGERTDSALGKFREVESKYPKTGAAILSRLAEGSLLLDKQKPDEALAAFGDVKGSALATADQEVKGRVLEGIGFAHELKAAGAGPEGSAKELDDALQAYKELENTVDVRGFKELAMYHQARVLESKGDKDKAKEILLALKTRLETPDDRTLGTPPAPAFPYLKEVAMDRLRAIDPAAAPKAPSGPPGGRPGRPGQAGGSPQGLDPETIRKMIEDAQRKAKANGGAPPAPKGSGH